MKRIIDRDKSEDEIRLEWHLSQSRFIRAWEKFHGDILPVAASISITINKPDPDNPTRYMLSTCIHWSDSEPDAIYHSPRRKWWERLLGLTPRFDWPSDR